MADDNIMFCFI